MDAAQLTLQLPKTEVAFLEEYAERHKVTIAQLIDLFVKQLRFAEQYPYHPDMGKFAGVVPKDVEVQKSYYEYLEAKHQ
ncbi:MAG: DUF6364 family protein [bacterium]